MVFDIIDEMKTIIKEYHIWASQDKVWDALVNPKTIEKWGAGPAKMSSKKSEKFSLWGGSIYGTNLEVIPQKRLVQEWYSDDDPDTATKAVFILTHKDGCTTLFLKHSGLTSKNYDSVDKGWDDFYLGEIKDLLEKD
ncbi:MAG: Activator of Hsp90 ATPase 1 family protein [Microgenomates group bacterium GW2011_GWC1_37_8]|uniref:Activator of Hsp90 ATPase 1 family protein n=1 Tax=Candidatus Woesebacteria bacterium GW2011_GWB1_38_8 TaxID=1618570 RepID=A0A0G0LCB7_9BACT|nr:MAG: Activator of Hsp90 ATPase 1 family protein [Microgenomates group bacterium GW2011_GWC1_37_8]KKQ85550.1 MAG: Activator of Hsp90 ATPase 1 family protein [Candidatus Woesebacteria bacterium GW2011_GWB1_38_8]